MEATIAQGWEVTYTGTRRWYVQLLPSLTDLTFLLPLFLLFVMLPGAQALLGDGDTGWHIRTGEWILQHKMVPKVDIFSFTKPHQAWFAWEWGWDVLFAVINRLSGLAGVVFVNIVLLGLISALLFRLIRRCSHSDALAALLTLVSICASTIHWLARPHLFSWLFLLIFLHVIASAEEGNVRGLYVLPLLTLFWTNLHGGFFIGIVLVATSAFAAALKALLWSEDAWRVAYKNSRPYLLCAVGCLAATFVNPYSWHLHQHIAAYLRDSKLLDNIQEFQSINFRSPTSTFFELMLLSGVPAGFWCWRQRKLAHALSILLWAHLALVSARNTPIFVLIAAPWVAAMSLEFAGRLAEVHWLRKLSATASEISDEFRSFERIDRWHVLSAMGVLCAALVLGSNRPGFEAKFNPKSFPLQAVPALESIKDVRVFTSDQWADYLIYRFYPDQQVFMDGRSDFYGSGFVHIYQHIMNAQYDWETDLKRFGIQAVMVKPDAPIAAALKESRRWKTVFDNGSVILFRAQSALARTNGPCVSAGTGSDGRNKLGVFGSSQVNGSNSTLKFQERRSL